MHRLGGRSVTGSTRVIFEPHTAPVVGAADRDGVHGTGLQTVS